jgi:hypothetical protein
LSLLKYGKYGAIRYILFAFRSLAVYIANKVSTILSFNVRLLVF